MSLDWSRPAHPVSRPASAVKCRECGIPFQAGHVPAGDPLCAECAWWATSGHGPALFDLPETPGGGAGLL